VIARSGDGFLEDQNGVLIAHLKGDAYTRGEQYGELLGDKIQGSMNALVQYAQTQAQSVPSFLWNLQPLLTAAGGAIYQPNFPQDVLDMLNGVSAGAARRSPAVNLNVQDLVFLNSVIDIGATVQALGANIKGVFKCSGLAAWGPRTVGGKTFQLRNIDLFVGTGLESQAVVIIEKPEGKKAFANATWAGMVGSASGMNENGVALSQVWAFSSDVSIGEPWILTARRVLETAENVDAVQPIFAGATRTYGSNFVFADRGDGRGGTPRGIALESTHSLLEQLDANDPHEDATFNGIPIAIGLPNAVFRGDTPVTSVVLARDYNVPPGNDPRTHGGYTDRYEQTANLVKGYEQQGVLMGAPEMETISKTIAMSKDSLQCVVYENNDLVLHVANSRIVPGGSPSVARDEPFHDYDFDYYLPTATVATDKSTYAVGDTIKLTINVGNHGRARTLDLRAHLEVAGTSIPLGSGSLGTVDVATGQSAPASASVTVPAGTVSGSVELVLELVESGTADTVDYATASITIQ
jgi:hypothetical protein